MQSIKNSIINSNRYKVLNKLWTEKESEASNNANINFHRLIVEKKI